MVAFGTFFSRSAGTPVVMSHDPRHVPGSPLPALHSGHPTETAPGQLHS